MSKYVLILLLLASPLFAQTASINGVPNQTLVGPSNSVADNILNNSPSTALLFVVGDSIPTTGYAADLGTLLGIPSGNQHIHAVNSSSLADMLSCISSCSTTGSLPLSFPLGVTSNSKTHLEHAYNDLSNMGATPTNTQLSYYFGGLKAWTLEYGIPDSQKVAANNTTYCTTTGTWTAATSVPGAGTFPTGTLKSSVAGSTITCTGLNATDAGIIGLKTTGSTTATFTIDVVNASTTYHVADPYTGSTTLNQTAPYASILGGISNFYAIGQSGLSGGYTSVTLTASNNTSDPVYVVAPYFISPSSSLQNAPAVEIMLESRAGCNGTCSTVSGPLHNDSNTNVMRSAQAAVVNELRSNGLNVSYFDPNATPSGFNSSDSTQTADGTHPTTAASQFIANVAFPILNSAAMARDHFLATGPAVSSVANSDGTLTISPTTGAVVASLALAHANTWTAAQNIATTGATPLTISSNASSTNLAIANTASGGDSFSIASGSTALSLANTLYIFDSNANGYLSEFSGGITAPVDALFSNAVRGWMNGTGSNAIRTCDTGASRDSAGVIDFGNCTNGNKSATINATTANFTGVTTVGSLTVTGVTTTGSLTSNGALTATLPGSGATQGLTMLEASQGTGVQVGMAMGQSIAAHQSTFYEWFKTGSTGFGSLETYASGDPIRLAGSQETLSGPAIINSGSSGSSIGTLPTGSQALCVNSGCTFAVDTSGNTAAASVKTTTYTVSGLPSASTLGAGAQVVVSDATTFTPGTCTGGGSDYMIAVSNGSTWSCH